MFLKVQSVSYDFSLSSTVSQPVWLHVRIVNEVVMTVFTVKQMQQFTFVLIRHFRYQPLDSSAGLGLVLKEKISSSKYDDIDDTST